MIFVPKKDYFYEKKEAIMSLSDIGDVCSVIGLFLSLISLFISGFIAFKVVSIKNDFSDGNHHNQKVGGIGNSATYSNNG